MTTGRPLNFVDVEIVQILDVLDRKPALGLALKAIEG